MGAEASLGRRAGTAHAQRRFSRQRFFASQTCGDAHLAFEPVKATVPPNPFGGFLLAHRNPASRLPVDVARANKDHEVTRANLLQQCFGATAIMPRKITYRDGG